MAPCRSTLFTHQRGRVAVGYKVVQKDGRVRGFVTQGAELAERAVLVQLKQDMEQHCELSTATVSLHGDHACNKTLRLQPTRVSYTYILWKTAVKISFTKRELAARGTVAMSRGYKHVAICLQTSRQLIELVVLRDGKEIRFLLNGGLIGVTIQTVAMAKQKLLGTSEL